LVWFDQRLVPHKKSALHLNSRDLKWDVKGGNYANSTVRPAIRCVVLTEMIAWLLITVSQETNTVTHKVFEEVQNDAQLAS
jgi:hypothetical protein